MESSFSGSLFYFPPCPACAWTLPLSVPLVSAPCSLPGGIPIAQSGVFPPCHHRSPAPQGSPGGSPHPPCCFRSNKGGEAARGVCPWQGDARGQSRSACDKGQCGRSGAGAGNPPQARGGAFGLSRRWLPGKTSEELKLFFFLWIPFEFCNAKENFQSWG